MVGNISEWNKPTRISDHIASGPEAKTVTIITTKAPTLNQARTVSAGMERIRKAPVKRPTIIPPHRMKR